MVSLVWNGTMYSIVWFAMPCCAIPVLADASPDLYSALPG